MTQILQVVRYTATAPHCYRYVALEDVNGFDQLVQAAKIRGAYIGRINNGFPLFRFPEFQIGDEVNDLLHSILEPRVKDRFRFDWTGYVCYKAPDMVL